MLRQSSKRCKRSPPFRDRRAARCVCRALAPSKPARAARAGPNSKSGEPMEIGAHRRLVFGGQTPQGQRELSYPEKKRGFGGELVGTLPKPRFFSFSRHLNLAVRCIQTRRERAPGAHELARQHHVRGPLRPRLQLATSLGFAHACQGPVFVTRDPTQRAF